MELSLVMVFVEGADAVVVVSVVVGVDGIVFVSIVLVLVVV